MFHPYSIEERPTVIPDVMRFTNGICSSQILQMLQSISSDYDIDFNDLVSIYQNSRLKLHLAGNIHYPPPKDIRCKARIRGRGYGHCQCKRRSIKDGLCARHHKQLQVCIEAGCERGTKGLGACTGHKGLRLGTMEHPIPTTNDAGERVVKWKKPVKFKRRTVQKIKTKKRIKIKKVINNDVKPVATPELSKTYLFNEVENLMNTIDFEDDSITVDTIIKRLQLHLQVDLTTYHTYLEKAIFKCFDICPCFL